MSGRLLSSVVVAMFALGCADKVPQVSALSHILETAVEGEKAGAIRLSDVRKTDGQSRDMFGVKMYSLEFEAVFDVSEDVGCHVDYFGKNKLVVYEEREKPTAFAGDRLKVSGEAEFERKESGWVVSAIRYQEPRIDPSGRLAGHSPEDTQRRIAQRIAEERDAQRRAYEQSVRVRGNIDGAAAHLERGQYRAALDQCEAALREAPDSREALELRDKIRKTMDILGVK